MNIWTSSYTSIVMNVFEKWLLLCMRVTGVDIVHGNERFDKCLQGHCHEYFFDKYLDTR